MSERKFKDPFVNVGITDREIFMGREVPKDWVRDDERCRWVPDVAGARAKRAESERSTALESALQAWRME